MAYEAIMQTLGVDGVMLVQGALLSVETTMTLQALVQRDRDWMRAHGVQV